MSPVLMNDLSDVVLGQILARVVSNRDLFSLAAVSHRFRRCVFQTLCETPQELQIDFNRRCLNVDWLPVDKWPLAVGALAQVTEFSGIKISKTGLAWDGLRSLNLSWGGHEDWCTHILRSVFRGDCLNVLTKVEHDLVTDKDFTLLCQIITYSRQISSLKCYLDLDHYGLAGLGAALRGKGLEEFDLRLKMRVPQSSMAHLFEILQPFKLKKLVLIICLYQQHQPAVYDVAQMFAGLLTGPWTNLESLEFHHVRQRVSTDLFKTLTWFRNLKKCVLSMHCVNWEQFAECVVCYFSNVKKEQVVHLQCDDRHNNWYWCGCQVIKLIEEVQVNLPSMQFKLDTVFSAGVPLLVLKFTLGKASLVMTGIRCNNCRASAQCSGFYGNLLGKLAKTAGDITIDTHLLGYWLDKCMFGRLQSDLNEILDRGIQAVEVGFSVMMNVVTVVFRRKLARYQITLDVHHCFDPSCVECMDG